MKIQLSAEGYVNGKWRPRAVVGYFTDEWHGRFEEFPLSEDEQLFDSEERAIAWAKQQIESLGHEVELAKLSF